jgi:biotin carboxyl carrier protein
MSIEVFAPLDGKTVRIFVGKSEEIEEDEPILTIEALKMEMPNNSPIDGKINSLNVKEGQTVKTDELLVIIDGKKDAG